MGRKCGAVPIGGGAGRASNIMLPSRMAPVSEDLDLPWCPVIYILVNVSLLWESD